MGQIRVGDKIIEIEKNEKGGMTITQALAGTYWDMVQICDQSRPYNLRSCSGSEIIDHNNGYWIHVTEDSIVSFEYP